MILVLTSRITYANDFIASQQEESSAVFWVYHVLLIIWQHWLNGLINCILPKEEMICCGGRGSCKGN